LSLSRIPWAYNLRKNLITDAKEINKVNEINGIDRGRRSLFIFKLIKKRNAIITEIMDKFNISSTLPILYFLTNLYSIKRVKKNNIADKSENKSPIRINLLSMLNPSNLRINANW
jgi:hypothetical protein